ncbi:unnamed protein product [Amoebophrya sp. A120]|nr:unnamed protein product [Amoebophrya sp. A120]|eukprot:GSA120T00005451001.1
MTLGGIDLHLRCSRRSRGWRRKKCVFDTGKFRMRLPLAVAAGHLVFAVATNVLQSDRVVVEQRHKKNLRARSPPAAKRHASAPRTPESTLMETRSVPSISSIAEDPSSLKAAVAESVDDILTGFCRAHLGASMPFRRYREELTALNNYRSQQVTSSQDDTAEVTEYERALMEAADRALRKLEKLLVEQKRDMRLEVELECADWQKLTEQLKLVLPDEGSIPMLADMVERGCASMTEDFFQPFDAAMALEDKAEGGPLLLERLTFVCHLSAYDRFCEDSREGVEKEAAKDRWQVQAKQDWRNYCALAEETANPDGCCGENAFELKGSLFPPEIPYSLGYCESAGHVLVNNFRKTVMDANPAVLEQYCSTLVGHDELLVALKQLLHPKKQDQLAERVLPVTEEFCEANLDLYDKYWRNYRKLVAAGVSREDGTGEIDPTNVTALSVESEYNAMLSAARDLYSAVHRQPSGDDEFGGFLSTINAVLTGSVYTEAQRNATLEEAQVHLQATIDAYEAIPESSLHAKSQAETLAWEMIHTCPTPWLEDESTKTNATVTETQADMAGTATSVRDLEEPEQQWTIDDRVRCELLPEKFSALLPTIVTAMQSAGATTKGWSLWTQAKADLGLAVPHFQEDVRRVIAFKLTDAERDAIHRWPATPQKIGAALLAQLFVGSWSNGRVLSPEQLEAIIAASGAPRSSGLPPELVSQIRNMMLTSDEELPEELQQLRDADEEGQTAGVTAFLQKAMLNAKTSTATSTHNRQVSELLSKTLPQLSDLGSNEEHPESAAVLQGLLTALGHGDAITTTAKPPGDEDLFVSNISPEELATGKGAGLSSMVGQFVGVLAKNPALLTADGTTSTEAGGLLRDPVRLMRFAQEWQELQESGDGAKMMELLGTLCMEVPLLVDEVMEANVCHPGASASGDADNMYLKATDMALFGDLCHINSRRSLCSGRENLQENFREHAAATLLLQSWLRERKTESNNVCGSIVGAAAVSCRKMQGYINNKLTENLASLLVGQNEDKVEDFQGAHGASPDTMIVTAEQEVFNQRLLRAEQVWAAVFPEFKEAFGLPAPADEESPLAAPAPLAVWRQVIAKACRDWQLTNEEWVELRLRGPEESFRQLFLRLNEEDQRVLNEDVAAYNRLTWWDTPFFPHGKEDVDRWCSAYHAADGAPASHARKLGHGAEALLNKAGAMDVVASFCKSLAVEDAGQESIASSTSVQFVDASTSNNMRNVHVARALAAGKRAITVCEATQSKGVMFDYCEGVRLAATAVYTALEKAIQTAEEEGRTFEADQWCPDVNSLAGFCHDLNNKYVPEAVSRSFRSTCFSLHIDDCLAKRKHKPMAATTLEGLQASQEELDASMEIALECKQSYQLQQYLELLTRDLACPNVEAIDYVLERGLRRYANAAPRLPDSKQVARLCFSSKYDLEHKDLEASEEHLLQVRKFVYNASSRILWAAMGGNGGVDTIFSCESKWCWVEAWGPRAFPPKGYSGRSLWKKTATYLPAAELHKKAVEEWGALGTDYNEDRNMTHRQHETAPVGCYVCETGEFPLEPWHKGCYPGIPFGIWQEGVEKADCVDPLMPGIYEKRHLEGEARNVSMGFINSKIYNTGALYSGLVLTTLVFIMTGLFFGWICC